MNATTATTGAISSGEAPAPENIKDTIESIVVALILAFVFRAFIVEAFVIPTGSMAPTLYGAHGTIVCEDCGTEFAYGLRDLGDQRYAQPVGDATRVHCPNCNHANSNLKINDVRKNPEKGDRILVLKWPFDIGGPLLDPQRWDVTVFKDPADGTTNFIKRLVGLPNEVLTIIDGDVFTVPVDRLSDRTRAELERYRHDKFLRRVAAERGRLEPIAAAAWDELDEKVRVTRKTDAAQRVLWTVVYDNDFPPRDPQPGQPRWSAGLGGDSGWIDTTNRSIRFVDRGRADDFIELTDKPIRATTVYNIRPEMGVPPVSDLRVRCVWTPDDGEAAMLLRLQKRGRTFWARVAADGRVALYESDDAPAADAPPMCAGPVDPFRPGEPVQIAFEILDYRLALRVRDEIALTSSDDPESDAYYAPDVAALRSDARRANSHRSARASADPPRLYGDGGSFAVSHLVVDRDIYYYLDQRAAGLEPAWAPRDGWASASTPILLREHEFFMLGDNTAASKDSRLWDTTGAHLLDRGEAFQLGTVPRDQLIGKAFFVYWPSGYRLDWIPIPKLDQIGMIPDVGRMRWIR